MIQNSLIQGIILARAFLFSMPDLSSIIGTNKTC